MVFGLFEKKPISKAHEEVAQFYEVGEITQEDCDACSGICYPSSVKVDDDPLYDTAKKVYAQILIATGLNNWIKSISDSPEPWGQVAKALEGSESMLAELAGGPAIRINGTDLEFDDAERENKVGVIVLPQFIKILTTPETCVNDVAEVLKLKPKDTLADNMIPIPERGFILLCSHRTRDNRCGITAPLMKKALDQELREVGLYRDFDDDEAGGIRVIMCNHVGGHKFAANALIYQNNGMSIMLARLKPEHAGALVHKTLLNNVVFPDYTRACNKVKAYSW